MTNPLKKLGKGIKKNVILPLSLTGLSLLNLNAQDTLAPNLNVISPVQDTIYNTKPISQFTVSDDSSGIDSTSSFIKFNNDTIFNWDSLNGETLNPQQGNNTIEYFFTDSVGNDTNVINNFDFDSKSPTILINNPQNKTYHNTDLINDFNVSDTVSGIDSANSYIELNGNPIGWATSNGDTLNSIEGNNALEYYFRDTLGNDTAITNSFVYDTTKPSVNATSPQNEMYYSYKPTNQFTASDTYLDSTNSFIKFNNDTIFNWDSLNGETLNPLADTTNRIEYFFTDSAGNDSSIIKNFVYDTTKPSVNATSPQNEMYYSYKPTNQFTASDTYLDSTNSFIKFNNDTIFNWDSLNGETLNPLADTTNRIEYFFTDSAGNDSSIIKNFVYDTTKPSVNATSPQNEMYYSYKPTNQFTASDTYLDSTNSFIKFNNDTIFNWDSIQGMPLNPIEGNNSIEYFFTDSAGNDSSIIKNFVYDTTAPFFNVDSIQDRNYYSYRPLNNFNVSDSISGIDSTNSFIKFNNDTIFNWDSIQGMPLNPIEGNNSIEYFFTDSAGNDSSIIKNFVYDTTHPSLSVSSPKNDSLYLNKPINSFSVSDNYLDSTNSCIKLNGNKIGWEQSNGDTLENLLEGTNTLEYFFTDSAGNAVTTQRNFVYRNSSNGFDKHWLINPFKQSETQVSSSYGNGDLNKDGKITNADVDSINNLLGKNVPNPRYSINLNGQPRLSGEISEVYDRADIDGDGIITPIDKAMILKYIDEGNKSYLPGRFWTSLTSNQKENWIRNINSLDKTDSIPENSTPGEVWNNRNYSRQVEINSKGIRNLSDITQEEYSNTLSQNPESLETLRRFNLPVYSVHNTKGDEWFNGILTGDDATKIDNWYFFNPADDSEKNSFSNGSKIEVKYNYGYNKGTGNFIDMTFLEWNVDSVGNTNLSYSASSNRFVSENPKYDNQSPEINFNLQNNSSYNKNTLENFMFTVSDTSSNNSNFLDTLWYQLDDYSKQNVNLGVNEVFPPKKSHSDTISVPEIEGEHQVQIYARDIAGNLSNKTINFIYDNTSPAMNVNHPDKDGVYSTHPVNDFTVSDAISGIDSANSYIKLNGNKIDWERSNGKSLEGVIGDTNKVEYYFVDNAGNDSSITRTWRYDNTPPIANITKPQEDTIKDNDLVWEIIEENLDTAWYVVNGKARGIDKSLIDSAGVLRDTARVGYQEGENNIEIYARDRAGNDTSVFDTVYSDSTYQGINKPTFEDYSTKAYPNPTRGDVNIKYNFEKPQDGSINIYNMNGQSLDKELIENDSKGTKRFNITGPNGTYIYRINTEKGYNKTGKIIKND